MVRLTDRPDMTLDVYRGRKTTIQQLHRVYPHNCGVMDVSHGECLFCRNCEGLVIKFCFFSLLSYIFGFREKRVSFLAFETNFLKQDHCDNNTTDACASHPVDINML